MKRVERKKQMFSETLRTHSSKCDLNKHMDTYRTNLLKIEGQMHLFVIRDKAGQLFFNELISILS